MNSLDRWNRYLLHWQVDSSPLNQKGSLQPPNLQRGRLNLSEDIFSRHDYRLKATIPSMQETGKFRHHLELLFPFEFGVHFLFLFPDISSVPFLSASHLFSFLLVSMLIQPHFFIHSLGSISRESGGRVATVSCPLFLQGLAQV